MSEDEWETTALYFGAYALGGLMTALIHPALVILSGGLACAYAVHRRNQIPEGEGP